MTTVELTAEEKAARKSVLAYLKTEITAYRVLIREEKCGIRAEQKAGSDTGLRQSNLARTRRMARARHIVYGLCRGRTWEQMEYNHPEGDPSLKHPITLVWRAATSTVSVPAPEALQPWIL